VRRSELANLYVGNLSFDVTDASLQQVFSGKGFQVASARVFRDRESGRSRGFGFVEFGAGADSARAITELNGHDLEGRQLQGNGARPQARRDRGGSRDHCGHERPSRGGGRSSEQITTCTLLSQPSSEKSQSIR
jgi:RNA recognition motif-containing protein